MIKIGSVQNVSLNTSRHAQHLPLMWTSVCSVHAGIHHQPCDMSLDVFRHMGRVEMRRSQGGFHRVATPVSRERCQ